MDYALALLLTPVLVVLVTVLTTTFHELAHACAAILLTRTKATVFLGSNGNREASALWQTKWLDVWFHRNPFFWRGGVCIPGDVVMSVRQQILFVAAGPLSSVVIVSVALGYLIAGGQPPVVGWFLILLLLWSSMSLISSLMPEKYPRRSHNGDLVQSDGTIILKLLRYRKFAATLVEACNHHANKRYSEALTAYVRVIENGVHDQQIYRMAISAATTAGQLDSAYALIAKYTELFDPSADDLCTFGVVEMHLEHYEQSLEAYDEALKLDPDHTLVHNNRGYTLSLLERYEEAVVDFDRAIELDPKHAFAYNNRGLARIRLGLAKEGLLDIQRSMELDESNSYAHRNLGIYHLEQGDQEQALRCLERAKELDADTDMIDEYLEKARCYDAGRFLSRSGRG